MLSKVRLASNMVIVKIYDVDRQMKETSEGGIITTNVLKPTMNACQIGEAINVGRNIKYIKKGEMVLFRWGVEWSDENVLEKDDTGEYRYVTELQIFGTIKNNKKTGYSHIQPKRHYFLAEPREKDFALTRSIFQIPISALNPLDDIPKKMGLKVGDWAVCLPYSAVPITVKRKTFFFVYLEDILYINSECHKLSVNRKYVSQDLRLASRKNKVNLN